MSFYCYCWKIEMGNGNSLFYTTHNKSLDFLGDTYKSTGGFDNTIIQKTLGLSVDNLDFSGPFTEDITLDMVRGRVLDGAVVTGYRVNFTDTSDYRVEFNGFLGESRYDDFKFTYEVRDRTFLLSKPSGNIFQRNCPFSLGDGRCGVDLTSFKVPCLIGTIDESKVTITGVTLTGTDYEFGEIIYPDGSVQKIRTQDGNDITLWGDCQGTVGDYVTLVQGCDKRRQTCKSKFDNVIRYGGFDIIPPSEIIRTVAAPGKDIYDGGSFYAPLN